MTVELSTIDRTNYPLRGTLVRGGTSKCWLFRKNDLPLTGEALNSLLVDAMGARDFRQIDGVGGGTSTTSKIAIVEESQQPNIDIEYQFGQVGIGESRVEWHSDCGNCATAIALFAIEQGIVKPTDNATTVRMCNTRTNTKIECIVETPQWQPQSEGRVEIPGVTGFGTGVSIQFRFADLQNRLDHLLPTRSAQTELEVQGRTVCSSLVVAGAPVAFIQAPDIGATATEDLEYLHSLVPWFTEARRAAGTAMSRLITVAPTEKAIPKIGIVGAPADYRTFTNEKITADKYDIALRMMSMDNPHPSLGLTTAAAVGAAAVIEGTLVHRLLDQRARSVNEFKIRVGTATGIVTIFVSQAPDDEGGEVTVRMARSARVLSHADIAVRPSSRAPFSNDARSVYTEKDKDESYS